MSEPAFDAAWIEASLRTLRRGAIDLIDAATVATVRAELGG